MGLPSWAYAGAGEGEWEDRGIFLRNRRTGEIRPKGIAGGLPGLGKVETPDTSALSVTKEALGLAGATAVNQNVSTARLPSIALQGVAEMGQRVEDTLDPEARRERADAYAGLALDTSPSARLVREGIESKRAARDLKLDPLAPAAAMTQEWEEGARERLAGATSEMPTLAAVGVHQLATMGGMAVDPTIGGGGKGVARELTEEVAEAAPKRISSLASRVLPGEDISERFASFLRGKGIEDPDLYHDLSEAARKALDREFLAGESGPAERLFGKGDAALDRLAERLNPRPPLRGQQVTTPAGDTLLLPHYYGPEDVEAAIARSPRPPGAAGATIPADPGGIPTSDLDRAAGGVATRPRINPEAGYIRLGPGGPPDPPPDPVLAGFHSEVFGREAKATAGEKLEALGNRFQREMVEAYSPLLKVARRFGPAAEDEIEVAIQRTRSASHTQMNPVLRFTEEYDPLANGGRGDWLKTGKPLTEEVTAKLSPSERVEVESILAAGSQVEFAARKEAAVAQRLADRAANTAERNMLRLLGQEQRRGLRGLSYEARALRAEELRAARREARATGNREILETVRRQADRAGIRLPAAGGKAAVPLPSNVGAAAHWLGQGEGYQAYQDFLKAYQAWGLTVARDFGADATHAALNQRVRKAMDDLFADSQAQRVASGWVNKFPEPPEALLQEAHDAWVALRDYGLKKKGSAIFLQRTAGAGGYATGRGSQMAAPFALAEGRLAALPRPSPPPSVLSAAPPPNRLGRLSLRAEAARAEAEGAAAAAKDTEGALRRGIGDLSRDELRRYRERLAIVRPPDIPDLRLDIDPVRTLQAREVMRHAEETGLLKKYDEVLGQASIDRSGPGTGYRGWADRAWLRPAVGAGFITEADRVAMLQKNQMYSLFQQIDTLARQKGVDMAAGEVPNAPRFLKNAPPSVIHGVRKNPLETRMAGLQEGRQIAPVLEASAIQAARFQRLVDRQLVKNKLAELVEQSPDLAPEIVKTTDPMAPGSFVAFKGGEKAYLQAPPDLLENLDRLTAQQAAFVLEAAQKATGALRVAATTYTPGFPFGNVARDVQRGWITSQHGMLPGEPLYTMGKEVVHRLFNRFEPSAMWREFDEGVASYSTFVKADSDGVNRAMQEAAQAVSGSPSARRIVDLVNPIAWLRELGQFKEAATRVTEKALARRGGRGWFRGQANPAHLDPATGAIRPRTRTESDLDAGKVSLNFMSGGSATREANRYYAFLNAQALDGADFFRQVTGHRKFTVIAKATAGITLPALYEVWHYRDDPEYRNLPWWDRSMFWHLGKMGREIPQGSEVMADGQIRTPTGEVLPPRSFWDGTWRRIPRPPGLFNLVFGILPSLAFEAVLGSNPRAGEEAVAGLVEQTPMQFLLDYDEPSGDLNANLFPMVPDALRPPLEAGTNLKGFPFGQAIDPRGTEEADPALRWNEQTPLWARELSERSAPGPYQGAVSPNRIQRVVEGYGAGAAKAAGGLVDRTLLAGRQDPNGDPYADTQDPLTPRDVPFLRSFMGSPAQGPGSAPVKEFWARYDTARQSMDVLEGWEKAGRIDQARKALEAHPELRYKSDLESTAKRLREMGKERKEILAAPFHVLGPEQKRAYLELVDQGMTQVAGQLLLYIQQQELARQQGER